MPRPTLSLRLKLVLLAFALVVVPGGLFGVMASRDAARALEATVGRQLHMVAGNVAGDLEAALAEQEGKVRGWAHQDVMREIIVGDVDKRIATFLQAQRAGDAAYLDLFVVDGNGHTIASSDPRLIDVSPPPAGGWREAIATRDAVMAGPRSAPHNGRRVIELAAPITDPENPGTVLGALLALYDWSKLVAIAAEVGRDLSDTGVAVDLLVLDDHDVVIGEAAPPGAAGTAGLLGHDLRADGWHSLRSPEGTGGLYVYEAHADALVAHVRLAAAMPGWTVLALQLRAEALAPIDRMRRRLLGALALVLTAGTMAATLLARRMTQPLQSLTEAARGLARGGALPSLPVRSRDEIGALTAAFNAMAADLRQAQHDLVAAAKLASVGEIAAGLAHEIRTPLGIMRGSAQMLGRTLSAAGQRAGERTDPAPRPALRGATEHRAATLVAGEHRTTELVDGEHRSAERVDTEHRTAELVDMIVGEVDRLERVVAALTELGRPHEASIEETLLAPLLLRAIEFVGGQAASQRITLTHRFDRPCPALCDPEQLYQVALNLLVNALHVLPAGGSIGVHTFGPEHGRVGFEIADDGPGIPAAIRSEIFTPFFTRREGGTGLGLAFVERVVVAHQGRVSVRDTPGGGATFRVELPAADGLEAAT